MAFIEQIPPEILIPVGAAAFIGLLLLLLYLRQDAARRAADARISMQMREFSDSTRALADLQREFAGRLDQLSSQSTSAQAQLSRSLQERMDGISKRVSDSLQASSENTAKSLGRIGKHLEVIDQAQQNIADLSGQVVGLQEILSNKQARGAFGEVQLENLVRGILPPSAYVFQAGLSNKRRVDCLIQLPNPPGPICIDSKFPLESYRQLRDAGDEATQKRAARDFRQAVLKHVNDIKERYIVPGETAESALLFLPSEAVYAELHANFTDVVEQSYRARVWIVSPTTLMATLNTVRAILKDVRMREQAGVLQAEIQKLMEDVVRLDDRIGKLHRHLAQADADLKQIATSTGKVIRRAERIEELQFDEPVAEQALGHPLPPPQAAE